jgi:hypothetical protein
MVEVFAIYTKEVSIVVVFGLLVWGVYFFRKNGKK